jgi:AraC-like DNA-binding protein
MQACASITGLAVDYPAGELIEEHKHQIHQIVHASRGVIRVSSESACWVVPPGRAIWMPAGQWHSIHCYTSVQMRTLYLQQDSSIGPDHCAVWSVSALMREIIVRLAERPRRGSDVHLIALLLDEIETIDTLPLSLPQLVDQRLRIISETINVNPADNRSLANWALQLGFSQRNLIRRFHAETGMTFRQWKRQARMLAALERLANREPVTRVALDVGYETASAFVASFRETFGVTPRQYFS